MTKTGYVKFWFWPFDFKPALFPATNIPNSAKCNRIFPGKGRRGKTLILSYLDSQLPEVFSEEYFYFRFRLSLGEKGKLKLDQKCKFWVRLLNLSKLEPFKKFSNNVFISYSVSVKLNHIWWSLDPKTSQKGLNWYAKLWKFITWQQQMLY